MTLTTLEILDPAAANTAAAFWMHRAVCSWRVPSVRMLPAASQGIQPEAKMRPLALMAWDCGNKSLDLFSKGVEKVG